MRAGPSSALGGSCAAGRPAGARGARPAELQGFSQRGALSDALEPGDNARRAPGGMPQTLSSTSMFTPCGFSPHLHSAKEDDQGGLIFQDGNLASASLDALIQHLIPTTDYYPEKAYIFTFLLSSRLFIEPHELLSRVCHKCVEQQRLDDPVLDKARIRKFGPKLLQLLTEWTETFPYDFQEERMIGHLKDMIDRIAPCDESCFNEQKKTSNLEAYVKWFNRLCYLVATEICMPAKKKQRAQVIEFFIDVARECFNIGNFNSLMAIISGMNMSPVSRLKKTWSKVKTAKFFILEHQMDPTGNFYNYRTALRGAAHRSLTAHSNREKIVIPFFSLLIKDIYFLNEGCANRLPNGHVNFEKFLELAKQVGEFITWKQVECPFEQDHNIIHYLHTAPIFTEDGLYLASYESESPENQIEKERWKSLRSTILGKT
ncbi:ras-GEF domain-containing family member 1C isoform X4 [Mauremys reevesii]|uniref:ras-GEF domain-containing family member 1C isoform X4 n=1 Tax=Mauremys reevesii TaxID=260615 RepID=UPI00193F2DC9|nr:ras-GEF domain-containing family member 1C isoform X4 [Mauremys reevesii]